MGFFSKAADAAANTVIRAVDTPRTVRQAIARRDRDAYAFGDSARAVRKAERRNR